MKLCVFCEHIRFSDAWPGTDITNGEDATIKCFKVNIYTKVSLESLQGWACYADKCEFYNPVDIPDKTKEFNKYRDRSEAFKAKSEEFRKTSLANKIKAEEDYKNSLRPYPVRMRERGFDVFSFDEFKVLNKN